MLFYFILHDIELAFNSTTKQNFQNEQYHTHHLKVDVEA